MTRTFAILLLMVANAVAAPPARFGRIDVYSVDGAFNVRDVRVSPGAQVLDVGWRGDGMADTGATAQARAREVWREIWVEVVPERDGRLQINFQGEHYRQQSPDDVRFVWVDQVRASGAELVNPDFEQLRSDGVPVGWRFSGSVPSDAISRDGSIATSGQVCAAVWYGAQLRQIVNVRAGMPVRVTAKFRAVGPEEESPETANHKAQFDDFLELQPQTITVTVADAQSAKLAKIRPLPLYNKAEWAITSRWDDNTWTNLKTREVLLEHGHRGTFFLNDPKRNVYGKDYGILPGRSVDEWGRTLASGGTTIGGHSLTHPMMSYQNRNRMFEEILGCRIALEATFDKLVNAYAFSFCNYRSSIEGVAVQRDIATVLGRAGYLQIANHRFAEDGCWPWGVAGLLPPDGRPIDNAFAGFLADEDLFLNNPAITYSMHSWYDTPEEWAGFKDDLNRYGNRPQWWYCNHNEYGAYRAQYQSASKGRSEIDGKLLQFSFQRPSLLDLNDPIPLSFEIDGIGADSVQSIECSDAKIERVGGSEQTVRFNLHHSTALRLPKKIDHVTAAGGEFTTSDEFPDISASLKNNENELALTLQNTATDPIRIQRVSYRLPLRFTPGVVFRPTCDLKANGTFTDRLRYDAAETTPRYQAGEYFFVAQIDLIVKDEPCRIYVSTKSDESFEDRSFPQPGFTLLGPIPKSEFNTETLQPDSIFAKGWATESNQVVRFKPIDRTIAKPLNAEVVPISGRWDPRGLQPCVFLARSTVQSPTDREVRLLHNQGTVPVVWLNGRRVQGSCTLCAGANRLLLAYEPPVNQRFSPEHAGPMFRIVDAKSSRRLKDICYEP